MLVISAKRGPSLLIQLITSLEGYAPRATTVLLERMTHKSVPKEPTQILPPIKIWAVANLACQGTTVVPEVLNCHLESVMQDSTAQVDKKQIHQPSMPVLLDIGVPWEAHTRYLVTVERTKMSSNREHARPALKVSTAMEPFLMQPTVAMVFSSQPHALKVTTVQMERNLHGSTSAQQVRSLGYSKLVKQYYSTRWSLTWVRSQSSMHYWIIIVVLHKSPLDWEWQGYK